MPAAPVKRAPVRKAVAKKPAAKRKPAPRVVGKKPDFTKPLAVKRDSYVLVKDLSERHGRYGTTRKMALSPVEGKMTTYFGYGSNLNKDQRQQKADAEAFNEAMKGRYTIKAYDCDEADVEFEADFEQFMLTLYSMAKESGVPIPPVPVDPI